MTQNRKEAARAVGLTKSDSQLYYERGLSYFANNKYEDAIVDLSEAIHYDQGRAELYAARGYMYAIWGKAKKLPDKLEAAMVDLSHAVKLNKRLWFAHLTLGIIDFDNGQWSDALRHFTDAKEASPGHPEVWYYRAICHYKLGNLEKAVQDMETALRWLKDDDKRQKDADKWLKEFRADQRKK
jgi:tetratricopeptide (TPR) repeat protein